MNKTILSQFKNQAILIVGDVMLDRYLFGNVTRISPEAPVPIVLQKKIEDRLGGAANVALNIAALGGTPILCSIVGNDEGAIFLDNILTHKNISNKGIIRSKSRKTTLKTRIIGNNQQMLRIDHEDTHSITPQEERLLLKKISHQLSENHCKVLVFQDYNKGVLTETCIKKILKLTQKLGILTVVDPKKDNFFAYQGVDLFKPNLKEIRDAVPFKVTPDVLSLQETCHFLRKKINNRLTMITLSEKGLYLEQQNVGKIYPTQTRNIADVSGAGDTVISIAALGMAAGLQFDDIAVLSNLGGGQVCQFSGVVPVNMEMLEADFLSHKNLKLNFP
jgi:D-glycero-beta-D-manno-heptose-7-phosphate kinase